MNARQLKRDGRKDAILCRKPFDVLPMDGLPNVLPRSRSFFIINTDPSTKPGSHWIMVSLGGDSRSVFFDSLGREPGYYHPGLARFVGQQYTSSPYPLQPAISQRCGQYALFMCLYLARNYEVTHLFRRHIFTTFKDENDEKIGRFYRDYSQHGFDYAYACMSGR